MPESWQLAAARCQITTAETAWASPDAPHDYDAAIVSGYLEHEEWARWTLQRVHRSLRPGGRLLLVARNMLALCSHADLGDLAGRVIKQSTLTLARALGRPAGMPPPFVNRRYVAVRLRAMLQDLGFSVLHWGGEGSGVFAPLAAFAPRLAARQACSHVVVCEKRPGYFGLDTAEAFPITADHQRGYEAEHRQYLDVRDRWLTQHPEFAPGTPRPLDVDAHAGREVLVLSPHPDDEVIGCGGTLLRLIAAGARVTIVQATDGSASLALRGTAEVQRVSIRVEEALAVGRSLGAAEVVCWREDNRVFRVRDACVNDLKMLLEKLRPCLVFTPFVTDAHGDHHTLNLLLERALAAANIDHAATAVLGYEVWSLVPANRFCDITAVATRRDELLLLYRTAMKVDDFIHLCAQRNYYNAYQFMGREGMAEAFYEVPANAFGALLESAGAPHE